jgi:hypothetical protein
MYATDSSYSAALRAHRLPAPLPPHSSPPFRLCVCPISAGAFCVFEACCGAFGPACATLRSRVIPGHLFSTILNLYRITLNMAVVAGTKVRRTPGHAACESLRCGAECVCCVGQATCPLSVCPVLDCGHADPAHACSLSPFVALSPALSLALSLSPSLPLSLSFSRSPLVAHLGFSGEHVCEQQRALRNLCGRTRPRHRYARTARLRCLVLAAMAIASPCPPPPHGRCAATPAHARSRSHLVPARSELSGAMLLRGRSYPAAHPPSLSGWFLRPRPDSQAAS